MGYLVEDSFLDCFFEKHDNSKKICSFAFREKCYNNYECRFDLLHRIQGQRQF